MNPRRRNAASVLTALIGLSTPSALTAATPLTVMPPAVAVIADFYRFPDAFSSYPFIALSLTGRGFGSEASPAVSLRVMSDACPGGGLAEPTRIVDAGAPPDACTPRIVQWTDEQVVLKLPYRARHAKVEVIVLATQQRLVVPVDEYAYEYVALNSLCPNPEGERCNFPLAIAQDPQRGTIWINPEFHSGFSSFDPRTGKDDFLPLPMAVPGPFSSTLRRCTAPTINLSELGEDVIADGEGNIWLSEGGGFLYAAPQPNRSRIVKHAGRDEPSTLCIYNVPGDKTQVQGLAYQRCASSEPCRARLWFAEAARIVSIPELLARGTRPICNAKVLNAAPLQIRPPRLAWFDPALVECSKPTAAFPAGHCAHQQGVCLNQPRSCERSDECRATCVWGVCDAGDGRECHTDADCAGECDAERKQCRHVKKQCERDDACGACDKNSRQCNDGTGRACSSDLDCGGLCAPVGRCEQNGPLCLTDNDCSLASSLCPWDQKSPACLFHEYALPTAGNAAAGVPDLLHPGHLAIDQRGLVWFTAHLGGGYIGRLDPASGKVDRYPLPQSRGNGIAKMFGPGPWRIAVVDPSNALFVEGFDAEIGHLDLRRGECTQLHAGTNQCITQVAIPGVSSESQILHSIARDAEQNLWFTLQTQPSFKSNEGAIRSSLGYVRNPLGAQAQVVLFPSLSIFRSRPGLGFSGGGIVIDPQSQDVWIADYYRRRLARLRRTAGVDVAVEALAIPEDAQRTGRALDVSARVKNTGQHDALGVWASLFVDGKHFTNLDVGYLPAGAAREITFPRLEGLRGKHTVQACTSFPDAQWRNDCAATEVASSE